MKIRAMAPVATLMFAAFLFLSATSNVRATVLITTGQCDSSDTTKCSASNAVITATAYIIKEVTPGSTDQGWANFQSAFNSWNASLAANNKWTLGTGNLSAEATLNVVLYRAYVQQGSPGCIADPHCGGAEIQVNYNNGGNPPFPIQTKTIFSLETQCGRSRSSLTRSAIRHSQVTRTLIMRRAHQALTLDPPRIHSNMMGATEARRACCTTCPIEMTMQFG